VRVKRIELLRRALLSGNVASLLRPPESDYDDGSAGALAGKAPPPPPVPITMAQASRVTTQGWAVVRFYEELDAIELGVLDGSRVVPAGGAKQAAAAAGGAFVGASAETVRAWAYDFEPVYGSSAVGFTRDQRGQWERELLIHEEHLRRPFHRWMVKEAKAEKLSVEAARDYLNSTLLRPPHVSEELLADYNISLPIALSTAWFWMKQSGAVSGTFKQSFYNDHHENAMVLKDKQVCVLCSNRSIETETAGRNAGRNRLPSS
jgi:hypothetical protein